MILSQEVLNRLKEGVVNIQDINTKLRENEGGKYAKEGIRLAGLAGTLEYIIQSSEGEK
jgi:hypothetical protein